MSDPVLHLEFGRGELGARRLQTVVDDVLSEIMTGRGEAAEALTRAGLDRQDLGNAEIRIEESGHGLDPTLTTIVVGIAVSGGSKVAETLWTDVLWPRIRRISAKAIGSRKALKE
jgi:hypothetical protein